MSTQILIPKLGVAMTEATLVEWLVPDGGTVAAGDGLYLLETEKVETEVDSPVAGTIQILGQPGETYPVGTHIATIG